MSDIRLACRKPTAPLAPVFLTKGDQFTYFVPIDFENVTLRKGSDGSDEVIVAGYASTTALDDQDEQIAIDAIHNAAPDYFKWSNVREMHTKIAAGVALTGYVDDKGLYLTSEVVDTGSIRKVRKGVLKGYSIGGQVLAKKGKLVTKIKINEVSLVDRPANPECVFDMVKRSMVIDTAKEDPMPRTLPVIQKSLYCAARAIEILAAIRGAAQNWTAEQAMEGEVDALSGLWKSWEAAGAAVCSAVLNEEIGEGVTDETPAVEEGVEAAASIGSLVKKGAKFSKETRAAMKELMDAAKALHEKMGSLLGEKAAEPEKPAEATPPAAPAADASAAGKAAGKHPKNAEFEACMKELGDVMTAHKDELGEAASAKLKAIHEKMGGALKDEGGSAQEETATEAPEGAPAGGAKESAAPAGDLQKALGEVQSLQKTIGEKDAEIARLTKVLDETPVAGKGKTRAAAVEKSADSKPEGEKLSQSDEDLRKGYEEKLKADPGNQAAVMGLIRLARKNPTIVIAHPGTGAVEGA